MFKFHCASENAQAKLRELFVYGHAIFLASGYAALTSALVAMGVGPGDGVIATGAMPVIADVYDELTLSA